MNEAGEQIYKDAMVYEKDGKIYMVRCEKCKMTIKYCTCKYQLNKPEV